MGFPEGNEWTGAKDENEVRVAPWNRRRRFGVQLLQSSDPLLLGCPGFLLVGVCCLQPPQVCEEVRRKQLMIECRLTEETGNLYFRHCTPLMKRASERLVVVVEDGMRIIKIVALEVVEVVVKENRSNGEREEEKEEDGEGKWKRLRGKAEGRLLVRYDGPAFSSSVCRARLSAHGRHCRRRLGEVDVG
eukprot:767645-Hanusia_phi.AAC.1